jgi:hypothetical protein
MLGMLKVDKIALGLMPLILWQVVVVMGLNSRRLRVHLEKS